MKLGTWAAASAFAVLGGTVSATELHFEGDMVRGHTQDGATGATCVLASQYMRKESVVWRVRVVDAAGENVGGDGLKSLVVKLADGSSYDMHFGTHPRKNPTDSFWATSWRIPADYPTGTVAYSVVATDLEGIEHVWQPFNVDMSLLTVIPGEVVFTK